MTSRNGSLITIIESLFGSPMTIGGVGLTPLPPNPKLPWVTVQEISIREEEKLDAARVGLVLTVAQINVWDSQYSRAFGKREVIRDYLYSFKGVINSNKIAAVNADVDREFYDGTRELHQLVTRFRIYWEYV